MKFFQDEDKVITKSGKQRKIDFLENNMMHIITDTF